MLRREYVEALKVERGFVSSLPLSEVEKQRRVREIDDELSRFSNTPNAVRSAPETARVVTK